MFNIRHHHQFKAFFAFFILFVANFQIPEIIANLFCRDCSFSDMRQNDCKDTIIDVFDPVRLLVVVLLLIFAIWNIHRYQIKMYPLCLIPTKASASAVEFGIVDRCNVHSGAVTTKRAPSTTFFVDDMVESNLE